MPFEPFYPRKFSGASITMYAPNQPGVYGISNARQWLYIGSADNIRAALLKHLQPNGTSIAGMQPTGFVFEVCAASARGAREERLIAEYSPVLNSGAPNRSGR